MGREFRPKLRLKKICHPERDPKWNETPASQLNKTRTTIPTSKTFTHSRQLVRSCSTARPLKPVSSSGCKWWLVGAESPTTKARTFKMASPSKTCRYVGALCATRRTITPLNLKIRPETTAKPALPRKPSQSWALKDVLTSVNLSLARNNLLKSTKALVSHKLTEF